MSAEGPWVEPAVVRTGDDVHFTWSGQRVFIRLGGIHGGGAERLTAEIDVLVTGREGAVVGRLEWGTITLASLSNRETLVRSLKSQESGESWLDWKKAIRYVCAKAAELHRQGEAFQDLRTVPRSGRVEMLMQGIMPLGQVTTLYGDGAAGKSLTAMLMCLACATGEPLGGVFRPLQPVKPLYLDWEATPEEHANRLDALGRGMGVDLPEIQYRFMQRTLADDQQEIRRRVDGEGIGLVVIDSMGLATGNVLDQDAVMRFYTALRALPPDVSKLVVTHVSAESAKQEKGATAPIGLRWVNNFGRSNFELRAERNDGAGQLDVAMYHRKANGFSLSRPLGVRYGFFDEGTAIQAGRFDVLESAVLAAHGTISDRIVALLREGPQMRAYIVNELGIKDNVARMALSRLEKAGTVRKADTGSGWRLIAGGVG